MTGRTIKIIPGTDVVEVRYSGEINYPFRISTLDELERIFPATKLHKLLINYTSGWPEPSPDPATVAAFGARLACVSFAKGARVALVNAPTAVDSATSAASAPVGFLFRRFDDRAMAIAWLNAPTAGD